MRGGISYSDGYLNPKGTGRVDQSGQAAYRLEAILRAVPARPVRKARKG